MKCFDFEDEWCVKNFRISELIVISNFKNTDCSITHIHRIYYLCNWRIYSCILNSQVFPSYLGSAIWKKMPSPYKIKILQDGYSNCDSSGMEANCTCTLVTGPTNIIVDTMTAWDREVLLEGIILWTSATFVRIFFNLCYFRFKKIQYYSG